MNEKLYDKVLGCLVGAGIGDAMGAPTEGFSKQEVLEVYGKRIEEFTQEIGNAYCYGNFIGEITDDASQMYEMAKAMIDCNGEITVDAAAQALVRWSKSYPKYYPRNAGATTSQVIGELQKGEDPIKLGLMGKRVGRGTTNGAAMRVASCGLTKVGDLDKAIKNAVTMCRPSHGTQHAFAGASAIACGITEALKDDATTISIVKACIYGIKKGEEIGLQTARKAEGIRVINMVSAAIKEALIADNMIEVEDRLDEFVGADGSIQSSIALAVGLFLASDGDPVATILSCTNIGGDSDTNACIAGMLVGAYRGYSALPKQWVEKFKETNKEFDFESVAKALTEICENNE